MSTLLDKVLAAHGGLDRWRSVSALDMSLSVTGGIWHVKGQPTVLERVSAKVATREPRVVLTLEADGYVMSEWTPDRTLLHTTDGQVLQRTHAREHFDGQFIASPWDALDAVYFCSYAIWTYFNSPFLFASNDVATREISPWKEGEESWDRLHITYPPGLVTHGQHAVAYFDEGGLLRRYDYVVDIMGGATGANYAHGYADCSGFLIPQHRQVFGYNEQGHPQDVVLVDIEVLSTSVMMDA
jgi:hypothetical protein